jgi:hypothetical protein
LRQNDVIVLKPKPSKAAPQHLTKNTAKHADTQSIDLNSNFLGTRSFSFKMSSSGGVGGVNGTHTPTPMMNSSFKLDSGNNGSGCVNDLDSLTTSYSGLIVAAANASFNNNENNQNLFKPSTQQSSRSMTLRTALSNRSSTHHTQSSLNLPKLLRRQNSIVNTLDNHHNHQEMNDSSASSTTGAGKSRRVSFGQIELQQLDIPIMYKHSNVALERFKLNPNFYLPDGTLKRKFSLPKLSDTLEQVKNCGYLRRHSNPVAQSNLNSATSSGGGGGGGSGYECDYDLADVKNIFKDIIQQNVSEYDLSYRE